MNIIKALPRKDKEYKSGFFLESPSPMLEQSQILNTYVDSSIIRRNLFKENAIGKRFGDIVNVLYILEYEIQFMFPNGKNKVFFVNKIGKRGKSPFIN